jgi:uncharacterized protein (TIGR02145 family)
MIVNTSNERYPTTPTKIKWGYLYNGYIARQSNLIPIKMQNDGWKIPDYEPYNTLRTYLEPSSTYASNSVGGILKESGLVNWQTPNTSATNYYGFSGKGAGYRTNAGVFSSYTAITFFLTSSFSSLSLADLHYSKLAYNNAIFQTPATGNTIATKGGYSLRLYKLASAVELQKTDGSPCDFYYGNDGKIYSTVKIGTQVWLANNLAETKYNDSSYISKVSNATLWSQQTTAAYCAYDNNETWVLD